MSGVLFEEPNRAESDVLHTWLRGAWEGQGSHTLALSLAVPPSGCTLSLHYPVVLFQMVSKLGWRQGRSWADEPSVNGCLFLLPLSASIPSHYVTSHDR
jgi:hypothetical protein